MCICRFIELEGGGGSICMNIFYSIRREEGVLYRNIIHSITREEGALYVQTFVPSIRGRRGSICA